MNQKTKKIEEEEEQKVDRKKMFHKGYRNDSTKCKAVGTFWGAIKNRIITIDMENNEEN